jgi:hypothetical protein
MYLTTRFVDVCWLDCVCLASEENEKITTMLAARSSLLSLLMRAFLTLELKDEETSSGGQKERRVDSWGNRVTVQR